MKTQENCRSSHSSLKPSEVGAVMVVGGGIAGIQASLELANQGFKVYLVEHKSAIGGHMAQLDKTFPTNDCAMCNISPKLVDVARNYNIEILTNTEVLKIDGQAGNFTAVLNCKPRYINIEKCVGCGDCAEVCPVSLPDRYEESLIKRKAAYRLYTQAVPAAYAIDKLGTAPCRDGCPAGQRAQGYIALIAEGRYREALRVIKEDNPFPSVCGRTCHHPCENRCARGLADESINIMALKRFVVDYALAYGREKIDPIPRTRPEWVAVIGSGPAGLTAAHDLVKMGYGVTVYEALPVPGGMMRVGIPAHRLPKGVLQQDIDDILALGVVLKTNSPIKDPATLLKQGYDAVCLATGISNSDHSLGLDGEDAKGVISAATFLRQINLGESIQIGDRVAVIGGGITALDAAAVARRLGAEDVYLVLDRPRGELPAYHWEVAAVESEGIHLLEKTTAVRILVEDDRVNGIELAETDKGMRKNEKGRRVPKIKLGTEFIVEVDTVIGTVGQFSDLNYLETEYEELIVDPRTLASQIPGIFVIGGRKTGASYIIEAVALGHQAASSIHLYLQNQDHFQETIIQPVVNITREEIAQQIFDGHIKPTPRIEPKLLSMEERVTSFREVVLGLTEQQARSEASRCLQCGICSECLACEYACETVAIDHQMLFSERQIEVGAVILAPGYQTYNAVLNEEYGFGKYPNVVTALQYERLLSASGPTAGQVLRPSDRRPTQKVAFLQCVGSRDQTHDYCSAVCCMYATKEAIMTKEHHPDTDIHIFMMDMRAFSKGYWRYYQRAKEKYGVRYHRCRVSSIQEMSQTDDLQLTYYSDDGQRCVDIFDLVVLSVGMEISDSVQALAQNLGIEMDKYGFCKTDKFNPLETNRPGIFAVGPFREPKDIPESIIEASGAAAASASLLSNKRWDLTIERVYPSEQEIADQEPRIGVFVCHCGSNIGGFLDVPSVTHYASQLPNVVHAEDSLYTCSQDSIQMITNRVQDHALNRVVVASCSPLTHAPLFQDSIQAAGLNPFLFEMANIRNQCSWVHSDDWDMATSKAKELVRMAVARAALLEPQPSVDVPVQQSALVVGGGIAGMTAAITLADQGYPVDLVEMKSYLGGNLRQVYFSCNNKEPQELLSILLQKIENANHVKVHLESEVHSSTGFVGNFKTTINRSDGSKFVVNHGATILATGAQEYRGGEYGYGQSDSILTQLEFEKLLAKKLRSDISENHKKNNQIIDLPDSVVMIQCVGPAEAYCSRICCTVALKNALILKQLNPKAQITVLYKDIRTYGFKERLYTQARDKGIIFIRYVDDHKPIINLQADNNKTQSTVHIRVFDPILRYDIALKTELLVLSMPVIPNPETQSLAKIFKVPQDTIGFFQEAHVKLRPVDFATNGIFMAGMAHYPKLVDESMIQAQAAAARASGVLSRESILAGGQVAVVDPALCTGCLTCVRTCPFGVPQIQANLTGIGNILGAAHIEATICQGCGSCVSECPAFAIQLMHYTDAQMRAKVRALMLPESGLVSIDEVKT